MLHVVRWRRDALDALLDAVDATGYALTLGVHTRIDETAEAITRRSRAGNQYVNRNMIGAVVGVQPFGGEGLSGTGPKAGGPLYLRRLLVAPPPAPLAGLPAAAPPQACGAGGATATPLSAAAPAGAAGAAGAASAVGLAGRPAAAPEGGTTAATAAAGLPRTADAAGTPAAAGRAARAGTPAQPSAACLDARDRAARAEALRPLRALRDWLAARPGDAACAAVAPACDALLASSPVCLGAVLPGVTGERNSWTLRPRRALLCVARERGDLLLQLAHVLAAGSRAVWPHDAMARLLADELPRGVRPQVELAADAALDAVPVDLALIQADAAGVAAWSRRLARREGPIVGLVAAAPGARHAGAFPLERLLVERVVTVNTAAAGGNASLTTVG